MKLRLFHRRIIESIRNHYGSTPFQPMDWTIMGYLLLIGLLVIPFHQDVKYWGVYPVLHAVIIVLLLEFIRFSEARSCRLLRAIRIFYPALFAILGWKELDNLITMIFPYWANTLVVRADLFLFGVHPTVWLEQFSTPWLTEIMNFLYALFWFYTPIVAFTLYFKRREQDLFDFLFMVCFAYAVCFTLFLIFPSEGAWIILKDLHVSEPDGGFFQNLNLSAQARGTIRGGALPSSHVSLAFVVSCAAIKYFNKLGWVLFALSFGIAFSTVYCQFHHAIDAIAGIITGVLLYWIANRILTKRKS